MLGSVSISHMYRRGTDIAFVSLRMFIPRTCHLRSSFSLVEMLVVVAIISVLSMLLMPALSSALISARMQSCSNNQRQISFNLFQYAEDFAGWLPCGDYSATLGANLIGWSMHLINTGYPAFPARASGPASLLFRCPTDEIQRTENDAATPNPTRHASRTTYRTNIGWDNTASKAGPLYSTAGNILLSKRLSALPQPSRTIAYNECPGLVKRMEYNLSAALFADIEATSKGTDFAGASGLYYTALIHRGVINFLFCDGHVANMSWGAASSQPALWTAAAD